MLMEMATEYLGMESYEEKPRIIPDNIQQLSKLERIEKADKILLDILKHYDFGVFSVSENLPCKFNPPQLYEDVTQLLGKLPDGSTLVNVSKRINERDSIMSHASNLSKWAMHLMHLNDMAKEGDLDRTVLACKMNILFFFSHSRLSKYFVENI